MINEKETCDRLLASMLGSWDLVEKWWNSPNRAFDGKHPINVFEMNEEGKKDVINYIFHHAFCGGGT